MSEAPRRSTNRPGARTTRGRPVRGGSQRGPSWRRWVVVGALATVTALVLVGYLTPVLGVREIRVTGTRALSEQRVLAASGVRTGTPMPRVDVSGAQQQVARLSRVAGAEVSRQWPSTVDIRVRERRAAAYQKRGGAVDLVDLEGVRFAREDRPPPGLPELRLPAAREGKTRAVMGVLRSLPQDLRGEVRRIVLRSPGDLRMRFADGREVQWGAPRDSARKAQVLVPLLTQPGRVYDVATPDLPTIAE
ncbi:FtsQ-type POTRA domain-containing protein [Salinifilum aidingensis]